MNELPFWKRKTLSEMSREEWESLCDGCGGCCVIKLDDEETGETFQTCVACRLFDDATARCSDYANRQARVPECIAVTPDNVASLDWFPRTCSYVCIARGRDLPEWHHLVCGDVERVHETGPGWRGRTVSEAAAGDALEDYIRPA
jgi:hypothetical protein